MPHLILEGATDLVELPRQMSRVVRRWGSAVIKTEEVWCRSDGAAVLVEGVVVEHSRPLHPVAVIALQRGDTSIRLWRIAAVERTPAVQRWLACLAADLYGLGAGRVIKTNLPAAVIEDLDLSA
jgi:hypothetical protein